ncbi:MAG: DUF6886 family protein [Caulobacterales bacterium]
MRLFHFSDDPTIEVFTPRPVRTPAERPPGREWLNGPLVWAIEEDWQAMYLFPRDCPRILLRQTAATTDADRDHWWGDRASRWIAHMEWAWFERLRAATAYRYHLPVAPFENLGDAGMWVAREAVEPLGMDAITDLPAALAAQGAELRLMHSLVPLKDVWDHSFHASGIRLRNAQGWNG